MAAEVVRAYCVLSARQGGARVARAARASKQGGAPGASQSASQQDSSIVNLPRWGARLPNAINGPGAVSHAGAEGAHDELTWAGARRSATT
eukprot:14457599-Alexandrium_andersonii.AAC.1